MSSEKGQELGRKGTALWAFKRMKEDLLPSLFRDLKAASEDGLDEEQCDLIKEILRIMVVESATISDEAGADSTVSEIWEVLDELRESYFYWNDQAVNPQEREAKLAEMRKLRDKVARRTRRAYQALENNVIKSGVVNVYQASSEVTSAHPQTFANLSRAVAKFQKANRQVST